ncbi:hypothetical protein MMC17_002850 [Xylographa soralifera]|nr:hypothetical protein [Xylographa soralifera]
MAMQEVKHPIGGKVVNFTGAALVQDEAQAVLDYERPRSYEEPQPICAAGITAEENSRMRMCWNKAMCGEMKIPEGYQNIAVLIVKWNNEIDQLNSAAEVEDLQQLFSKGFKYPTEVINLHNITKPQLQLSQAVLHFVCKYDGPHNLLIVYYTGHAQYHETKEFLELFANDTKTDVPENRYPASANWDNAEKPLSIDAESDVLAILDTCFASNLYKNRQQDDLRVYEILAATGHDKVTAGPGPKSFTTALISALKELLDECGDLPFLTKQLCDKINLHPMRRKSQSHVWPMFKRYDRSIQLAPLQRTLAERKEEFNYDRTRGVLSLRLPLTVEFLTDQQISTLA